MLLSKIYFKAHSIMNYFSSIKQQHPKSTKVSYQPGDKRTTLKISTTGFNF